MAARTQSSCTRRMSAIDIAMGTTPSAKSPATAEGATEGSRDSEFSPWAPVCESSMPASEPYWWIASVVRRSASRSPSSHIRTETYGDSSESRDTAAYSVHTPPHPPSAFIRRCAACVRGFSTPKPVQCGTW